MPDAPATPGPRRAGGRFLLALSAANFSLFAVWWKLLPSAIGAHNAYHYKEFPARSQFAAAILLTATLALLYFGLAEAWRRWLRPGLREWAALGVWVPIALGLNAVRLEFPSLALGELLRPMLSAGHLGLVGLVGALLLLLGATLRWRRVVTGGGVQLLRVASPFVFVTLLQAALAFATHDAAALRPPPAPPLHAGEARAASRVVWVIFDELDYGEAFVAEHPDVELGAFSELREASFFATRAYAPAMHTLTSLPALLSGRLFRDSQPAGASRLLLHEPGDATPRPWKEYATVFGRARERGLNTGLAGWAHPYCRVLGNQLNRCFFARALGHVGAKHLRGSLGDQLRLLARSVPGLMRGLGLTHEDAILRLSNYEALHQHALDYATDARLDLVLLHYSIPHLSALYERESDSFPVPCRCDYLDNLELANRALTEIRGAMRDAGLWEHSTLLISSDHWWRRPGNRDPRVPFLVRTPGPAAPLRYHEPFNSVLSADLVLALLEGRLADPTAIAQWIDARRAAAPHPWFRFARDGQLSDYRLFDLAAR